MRLADRQVLALLAVMAMCWPASAKEVQSVTVSYVVGPAQPLPAGLKAVAVIDSGVATKGVQQDEREQKWSVMAADMIEAMLQAGTGMGASQISVAKRDQTQAVLAEHDLALAGLVEGTDATRAAKLLAVQGLITSRITINIEEQRGRKSTVDWMQIMGGVAGDMLGGRNEPPPPPGRVGVVPARPVRPGTVTPRGAPPARTEIRRLPDGRQVRVTRQPAGTPGGRVVPQYRRAPSTAYVTRPTPHPTPRSGGGFGSVTMATKEVEEIRRHLTIQCSFSMIDAVTGQALLQYSPPPIQKTDQRSPDFLFGSLVKEGELDPVDHFIGELVEQATREFVSMIVPVQIQQTYEIVGRHSAGEAAVRALRADDYETAMRQFEANLAKEPDEHENVFAMGVVCELIGQPDRALEQYRRALSMEDVDEEELAVYQQAKQRLSAHLGRIVRPQPPGAVAVPQNPAPPAPPPPPPPATEAIPPPPVIEEVNPGPS